MVKKPEGTEAPAAEKSIETPKAEEKQEAPKSTYASGSASPAAKKILEEKSISTSEVKGTGRDGRITKDDAVKAIPSMGTPAGGSRGSERKKLSMLRRKVAQRLVSVKNETAMLTTFNEVDMNPFLT